MTTVELPVESRPDAMTDVGVIWKAAMDRYGDITKVKIESLPGANNVDEIMNEIHEREKKFKDHRHDGSKLDRFRSLVSKSLDLIDKLGNVVASAASTPFPPSVAIFTAVRYLISTVNSVSADYDKIAGFFEDLDLYLNRLKILERRIPPIPELKVALTEVLTSVLVLCGIYVKYINTNRIGNYTSPASSAESFPESHSATDKVSVKGFRNLVSGEDDELTTAYAHFHKMVEQEQGAVMNATLAAVEQLKGRDAAVERDDILKGLSSLNFHEKQRDNFAKHHQGTGQWLLKTDKFQRWFNGEQNSILWCHGIQGAGKTVITSIAVSFVEEATQGTNVAIAYIYCNYKDPKTQSEVEILSSITRQLAEQIHPLPPEVKVFSEKNAKRRRPPTEDERLSLVRSLCLLFRRTYVFVDALDDCPERNRENFLRLIEQMVPFIRLFITSRPHVDLQAKFATISRIQISASDSDIQTYLESEIETNNKLSKFAAKDPKLKADIIKSVNAKADGMFLLVSMQAEHLCKQTKLRDVRKALNTLPKGVYATYEDAIKRIEDQAEEESQLAKRALSYIFCARRPLNVEELRHALAVEVEDTESDETAFVETELLLNISAGLIKIDEKSSTIGLVHSTLQEYLETNREKLLTDSGLEIAKACLIYLSFDVFGSGPCGDGEALDQRLQEYRFLDYASHNWGYHVKENQENQRMNLLLTYLEDSQKLSSSVQVLHMDSYRMNGWHNRFPTQFSPLHVVAYWGMDEVLPVLFERGININGQDSYGATALQLAAEHGHKAVVRLLLEKRAEVNKKNHRGETALYWAARNGRKEIVELLIVNGANVMTKDNEGWTALDWAVIGGYNEVVKMLLEHGVDIGAKEDGRNNALRRAAEEGHEITVQMLLDSGADVNAKDEAGSTALDWATAAGHETTVRVLLRNGADVNSRDAYDNSALHWAIPHEMLVQLLLHKGAIVNAKNNYGQTALCWTAKDGPVSVAQLLLKSNADINTQDRYGFTALHGAALRGREPMVRLLLESGANPNEKDKDGWTPLHVAAIMQHERLVHMLSDKVENGKEILDWVASQQEDKRTRALLEKIAEEKTDGSTAVTGLRWAAQEGHVGRLQALLEKGADVNEKDIGGWTALTIAAWAGQDKAVQLLLEKRADVNILDRSGRPALHWASEYGNEAIVQLLVENGVDVNTTAHGWTAMLLAAKNGYMEIVRFLVEKGADVNVEDYHGRTALHWTAKHGNPRMVRLLVNKGAHFNAVDRWGRTVLIWAVENMQQKVVKVLLEIGADIQAKTRDGLTALHLATFMQDEAMVHQLLDRGANIEATTRGKFTTLHIAAFAGCVAVVQLLLERGADVNAESQVCGVEEDNDSDNGDGYDTKEVGGPVNSLNKLLHQLLLKQGTITEVEVEARHGLTARRLAASGGHVAVQRLL